MTGATGTTGATGPPSPPEAASARSRRSSRELERAEADATGAVQAGAVRAKDSVETKTDAQSYEARKRDIAEQRRREKAIKSLRDRISELESRIAARERSIKDLESAMASPGFYEDPLNAKPIIDQHQALMWEVGDLLNQWEMLQHEADELADLKT